MEYRMVDLGSCLVEYHDSDNGKPALLILGDVPSHLGDYEAVLPTLEQHFRVIALQWPGFGSSALKLNATTFGGAQYLHQLVLQFMAHLGLRKNTLVLGVSVGAMVALRVAVEFPGLVGKLVLVSPCGFASADKHYATAMSGKHYPPPGVAAREYLGNKDSDWVQQVIKQRVGLEEDDEANKIIRSVWRSLLLPEADLAGKVDRLRTNVFIVLGRDDPIVDPMVDGELAKRALGEWVAGYEVLDNTRHLAFVEHPNEFLATILPFLQEEEMWL
ncbi:hypothetical protein BASA81_006772 [Batrachochytrium salamandrivorans]|nr:hypothetical protein BASA81_006772 [Batrachochytrium salamandrivorans]